MIDWTNPEEAKKAYDLEVQKNAVLKRKITVLKKIAELTKKDLDRSEDWNDKAMADLEEAHAFLKAWQSVLVGSLMILLQGRGGLR